MAGAKRSRKAVTASIGRGRLILDSGAFIAYERGDERARLAIEVAVAAGTASTSAGVVAQVWAGDARQARLARLLAADGITEHDLDGDDARRVGVLLRSHNRSDVIDGHVALLVSEAERVCPGRVRVLTSDPDDLAALDVADAFIVAI